MTAAPEQQIPGVYHRRIGDIVVSAVSDGVLQGSLGVLQNIAQEEASRILTEAFRPLPRFTSINTFVIRAGGRAALVDTGSGTALGPTVGKLPAHLAAAGIDRADIDTVILTHVHPDHSNGLVDDKGRLWFPNAELVLHEAEMAHWHDDAAMSRSDEAGRERNFMAARRQLAPYRGRARLIQGGEVFPGVTAMPLPGHTPGHTGYMISSGAETLLIWGDIVHVPEIQVPHPEVTVAFDVDPAQAEATRRRMFDMVASDRLLIAGMHVHFPGLARVARQGTGYALVPEPWVQTF
ncbi:MAG: MBL fold metallo-hydrolase [Alphaproteobacteria bacterium]|nr:MBL fold metallo-hydrolase [Alphaproteobacteria bacterium]